jgi:hypothetical protein
MQLIDALEYRADSVGIVESVEKVSAYFQDSRWYMCLDGAEYEISESALEILLNLLRIPVKYIYRCVQDDGAKLAQDSINFWLSRYGDLSFLIKKSESPLVSQVYAGSKLYLPSVKVNDHILDYLKYDAEIKYYRTSEDIFDALYITSDSIKINHFEYRLGVKVLYSDCFSITPRFDGVVYCEDTEALFCWPTVGRKFRVASSTIPQVMDQIDEFLELSIQGLTENLLPALTGVLNQDSEHPLVDAEKFVSRLCSDLRYSNRVRQELIRFCTRHANHFERELLVNIASYTNDLDYGSEISMEMAREIQIALSMYAVKGEFK